VPLLRLAEAGDVLELALRDRVAERRRVELVLEDLLAVQPVLDVAAVRADFADVPFAGRLDRTLVRLQHVVERGGLAVRANLGVGVPLVVDDLILVADCRALILEDEVLHAAVGARRRLPFPAQVEVVVHLRADDVARAARVLAVVGRQRQRAVLDLPARLAGVGLLVAPPAGEGLPVEQRRPGAVGGPGSVCGLRLGGGSLRRERREDRRGGEGGGERELGGHVVKLYR
jgi:hypothetical protein